MFEKIMCILLYFLAGASASVSNPQIPNKTYAQALTGRVDSGRQSIQTEITGNVKSINQQIQAKNVTINMNTGRGVSNTDEESLAETTSKFQRQQVASFIEAVDRFDRGDFILITGKQTELEYVYPLTLVKWIAVFDFDPESRVDGLLSSVETTLKKRRSLPIGSIQDTCSFREQNTNWIFMMGCVDRPDTLTKGDANCWKKINEKEIDKKLSDLKDFETGVTDFTFVVLWPSDTNTAKCVHSVLDKVCTRMGSSVVIVDTCLKKSEGSLAYLNVLKEEKEVRIIELGVKDLCRAISNVLKDVFTESSGYSLPTKDRTNNPHISEERAQWLKEDFEILYMDNKTGVNELSLEQMKNEMDTFNKGGTLSWVWWYVIGPGRAEIKRDEMNKIFRTIKKYIKDRKSEIITLQHSPGSGGTTLSQSILWELKDVTPCAQIKHNTCSAVTDLIEKITCLSDVTNMPVVILLDGEDEHRVHSLKRLSERMKICVIMFWVRRYIGEIDYFEYIGKSITFKLGEKLTKQEARVLRLKYIRTEGDKRHNSLEKLIEDVENDKPVAIFEFGLAAHSYEYRGIQSYVNGYLKLSESEGSELQSWQRSLAYLSLVYFYGHSSIPCHFFTDIVCSRTDKKVIMETKDFPEEMQEFVVRGMNESRTNTVRISHFYIAKEILDQILTRESAVERPTSPYLCSEAKKILGTICPEFIKTVGKISKGNSSDFLSKMLINTFITREHKDIREDETQDKRLKGRHKPSFSHILEDASSSPPFSERFDILKQLVVSFPLEAQFRAHLGRLYMLCRPEDEEKAEENLRKAYEMSSTILDKIKTVDEIPYSRRLDIRNICHMYGNMLSKKVFKYTGKCSTDIPVIRIENDQFPAIANKLLPDVQLACSLFMKNREVMSPGNEDCLGFVGEIQIRLMFCRFIKDKMGIFDLGAFANDNDNILAQFVNDCFANLETLFDEMCELCDISDKKAMEANGQPLQEMYMDIMDSKTPGHFPFKTDQNTPRARRCEIGKLKRKYGTKKSHGTLEMLKEESELKFVVRCFERNFQADYLSDKDINTDYREWLRAIRHPKFPERYSIEKVHRNVEHWYENSQKDMNPRRRLNAKFYYFVLTSLIGFGSHGKCGNAQLLCKSQMLRKELIDIANYSQYPKNQQEWLGPPVPTIDRIIPGKRFYGDEDHLSLRKELQDRLEIRLGTICPPNNRPSCGHIALDLGPENRETVKIHFVPKKWKMKGTEFKSRRVEFVVGFNMAYGYEAFLVKSVGHVKCSCGNTVEKRSCDSKVKCRTCLRTTDIYA